MFLLPRVFGGKQNDRGENVTSEFENRHKNRTKDHFA